MESVLAPFQARIESLCRECSVQRLDLFGSALDADSLDQCNDLDFIVRFLPLSAERHARAYLALWKKLEQLLGKPVDLLEGYAVRNPYLRYAIHQHRRTLYAA